MKKNLLISAIVIAVIVATVAISFAAWDAFSDKDDVTFNTGENVALTVSKDADFTIGDKVLVPNKALKQNENYAYEVQIAKDVAFTVTGAETIDTVDYFWNVTKVAPKTTSAVIKDVETFNKYFTLVMRPVGATDDKTDVKLGDKFDVSKKYNIFVKFAIDADAQERLTKVENDVEKLGFTKLEDGTLTYYTQAEYDALDATEKAKYEAAYQDIFGTKFAVKEFKTNEFKIEITFDAENKSVETSTEPTPVDPVE